LGLKKACLLAIRVRGRANVPDEVEDTLRMLNLIRVNHATLVPNTPSYVGMLRKAKDWVTWGEVSKEIVAMLLRRKAELAGGRKLNDKLVRKLGYGSVNELAEKLYRAEVTLNKTALKPVFRLHPPTGGYERSVLKAYGAGGELGYRGRTIDELVSRMM
jgi:large subunit ribosomal protein L30